tara:strand:+ start:25411 stop:25908 length:498 start_codon:yes stop_codon:yes gene_type:complete
MNRADIETLYRRYGPMVLRRARRLLGNEQAALDAMHEVFIKAIKSGDGFRGEASHVTWLYRITTNYCLNQIRDSNRQRDLLDEHMPAKEHSSTPTDDDRLSVQKLLSDLPVELRDIVIYYYIDDMNHGEIANMLGVSRRTVGNRLETFRAIAQEKLELPAENRHV